MSAQLVNAGSAGYRNRVRKFARVTNLDVPAVMWDGANGAISQPDYQGWLVDEDIVGCVSGSALDAEGSVGAYALQITGQGNNGIEKSEVVILEGLTPVFTTGKFQIVYTAQVINLDAQTNGNISPVQNPPLSYVANRGLIQMYSQADPTKIMAAIKVGLGRTQMAIWRCPKNKYGEFRKIGVYPESGKAIISQLFARSNINESWINVGQFDQDGFIVEPSWPKGSEEYISPGTDLCLVILPGVNTVNASGILWANLYDIPNYDKILAEEAEQA